MRHNIKSNVRRCGLIMIVYCADAPGKTDVPAVEDVDEDSMTLSWGKPLKSDVRHCGDAV